MAKNKIGIEVDVKFPSIKDLQTQIDQKYDEKIKLKVKLGVSRESMTELKTHIQNAFDKGKEFKIKLDLGNVIRDLKDIKDRVDDIDKKLGKKRTFKIDFNIKDMDKTMEQVLLNQEKASKELTEKAKQHAKERMEAHDREVANAKANAKKLARVQETIYNAGKANESKRTRIVDDLGDGNTQSTTVKMGGDKDIVNNNDYKRREAEAQKKIDEAHKQALKENAEREKAIADAQKQADRERKNAIGEIEDSLKRVHRIEMDLVNATGKHKDELLRQKSEEEAILNHLKTQFYTKNQINGLSAESTQELIRQQKAQLKMAQAIKEEREERKEIQDRIRQVIQLENKKQQLARQIVTASEEEARWLRSQYDHYHDIQRTVMEVYDIHTKMSAEQRDELENIRRIGFLQVQQTRAVKEEREEQQRLTQEQREKAQVQKQALSELKAGLKEIFRLEKEIKAIEDKITASGREATVEERNQLQILREHLALAQRDYQATMDKHNAEDNVTDEMKEQLRVMKEVHQRELERIQVTARIQGEQEKSNNSLKEYQRITKEINKLQRDLIFAGIREEAIIQRRIAVLEDTRNTEFRRLETEGQITNEMRQQIRQAEHLQRVQNDIARQRREARERDQHFNNSMGLVDPWTIAGNLEQGAMEIIEPLKRIDEALTGVRKVAEGTQEQFREFENSIFEVGSSLGVTSDDYVKAVEQWATAGKSLAESEELAQTSMVGAFVGNITPDDMVKYMSVPMTAYKDAGLEATDVINSMNEVANENAIEMNDLGKAYMRSATTAKSAGASFSELTGFITAAQEATRKGGERIGTGLKTIGVNIQSIQSRWKKIDKTNFDYLSSYGVKLMNDDGSAKKMYDVLQEIVNIQGKVKPEVFSNIVKALSGKEHQETLLAIIDQWDTVNKVIKESEDELGQGEDGSAYIEHAKQADSVKFKLAELKNAWDELMVTMAKKGGAGDVLHMLTEGLEELTELVNNESFMKGLKFILGAVVIHAGMNGFRRFFDFVGTGLNGYKKNIKDVSRALRGLRTAQAEVTAVQSASAMVGASSSLIGRRQTGGLYRNRGDAFGETREQRQARVVAERQRRNDERANRTATANTVSNARVAGGAIKAVAKGVLGFIPILGDVLLISELLGFDLFGMFDRTKKIIKENTETAQEFAEALDNSTKKTIATNGVLNGTIQKNKKSYEELVKARDFALKGGKDEKTGKKVKGDGVMTSDEFIPFKEKFNEFTKNNKLDIQITMNDPEHIQDKLDELNEKLAEIHKKEVIDLSKKFEGTINKADEAKTKKKEAESRLEDLEGQKARHDAEMAIIAEKLKKHQLVTDQEMRMYAQREKKSQELNDKIKKENDTIDAQNVKIKATKKSAEDLATKMEEAVEKGGDLSGVMSESADAAGEVIEILQARQHKLVGIINEAKQAIKELGSESKLSGEQWQGIQKQFGDLQITIGDTTETINDLSLSEVNGSQDVKDAIAKVIKEEQKRLQKQSDNQVKTIQMLTEQTDSLYIVDGATGKVVQQFALLDKNIRKIPKEVPVHINVTGDKKTDAYIDKIMTAYNLKPKTVQVNFKGNYTNPFPNMGNAGKSVSVASATGLASNSVSVDASTSSLGGSLIQTPVTIGSIDNATSSKSKSTEKKEPPAKVNSDVWRYWGQEMYGIGGVEMALDVIAKLLDEANGDYDKMIHYYQRQQQMMNNQIKEEQKLRGMKSSEMFSVLKDLRKYGFKYDNFGRVTNLGHSKSLKGDKASEAEELLNKWKSLYQELDSIDNTIDSIKKNQREINDQIKDAKIQKELESWNKYLKGVDASLTSIENKGSIFDRKLGFISSDDTELSLKTNEEAMNDAKGNIQSLITQFNKLSKANIAYEENGETLKATLDKLGQEIISQADAVIKYQEAINDIEFARVTQDLDKFNKSLDENNSRIDNNIQNLKDGLLSGTDFKDLVSSQTVGLDLSRDNALKQNAKDRIALEQEVQDALVAFAKKNVDRQKGVANTTLEIESKKFNQMLKMESDYTAKRKATYDEIKAEFDDLTSIGLLDEDYKLVDQIDDAFDALKAKQDSLTKKYSENMAKALSPQEQENLTNQYVKDNLKLQEEYYRASIKANNDAIAELNKQLTDTSMADEQVDRAKEQIASLEKENIDSQNSIKEAISKRFDFEFSLLEESVSRYEDYAKELEYAMSIIEAVGGKNNGAKGTILEQMMTTEKARHAQIAQTLDSLKQEMSLYEEGSYEWKLINDQVKSYNDMLQESNQQLIDMNKNILANSFEGTKDKLERSIFGGKSVEELDKMHELWMTGLEREIALEDTYQRLADLGTKNFDEKMALLAKQEKLSKFEMDYLNKQLDVLELQQKLENLNKEKTIQTLKQNADGTWDWSYEADAEQIKQTQEELNQKQLELQQAEEQAQKDYLSQLDDILQRAQDGQFDSIQDFQDAIDDLGEAFATIVGDFPQIKDDYLKELIDAYSQYITENGGILSNIGANSVYISDESFSKFSTEIKKVFTDIGDDIGKAFATALLDKMPNFGGNPSTNAQVESKSISINLEKLEFPNIKTADGLKDAILSLPQIALQRSKEKL